MLLRHRVDRRRAGGKGKVRTWVGCVRGNDAAQREKGWLTKVSKEDSVGGGGVSRRSCHRAKTKKWQFQHQGPRGSDRRVGQGKGNRLRAELVDEPGAEQEKKGWELDVSSLEVFGTQRGVTGSTAPQPIIVAQAR